MCHTHTVQAIHEAFGRGAGAGRAVAAAAFFEALAPLTITRLEPHTVVDGGDKVLLLMAFEATSHGRHNPLPNNGHPWPFNFAGKVVRYDHVTDTAQMIKMARGESQCT